MMSYKTWSSTTRWIVLLAAITLVVYGPLWLWTIHLGHAQIARGILPQQALPVSGADSVGYVAIANSMLAHGQFRLDTEAVSTFRTPVYPSFIAAALFIFHSYFAISFLQIVFVLATVILFYLFVRQHLNERAARIVSLVSLLSVSLITHSLIAMSDVTASFFVMAALYTLLLPVTTHRARAWVSIGAGVLMGAAILTRPIAMFLPIVLAPFFIVQRYKKEGLRTAFLWLGVFYAICAIVIIPWMIRNERVSGVFSLSALSAYNLFHYNLPEYASITYNLPLDAVRADFESQLSPATRRDQIALSSTRELNAIAFPYLRRHLVSYTVFHVVKTAPFFFTSSVRTAIDTYNLAVSADHRISTTQENISTLVIQGHVAQAFRGLIKNPFIFLEQLLWLVVFVCGVYAVVRLPKNLFVWLCVVLVLYFALLTGPISYSRYRLPAEPFMFTLAVVGALSLWRDVMSYKNKIQKSQ